MNNGFETNGTHEFIAEIYDFQCSSGKNENIFNNENNITNNINNKNELNITVSPNPFSSEIEIKADSAIVSQVKLFDINSKTLYNKEFKYPVYYHKIINNDLTSGIYLLKISGINFSKSYKLIKL